MIFQCIHQTQSLLTYQMPTPFSNKHVISGSHSDNLVCGWDLLDPSKKWPSHSTHFQPWATHPCKYTSSSITIYTSGNLQWSEYCQCHVSGSVFHTIIIIIWTFVSSCVHWLASYTYIAMQHCINNTSWLMMSGYWW